MTQELDLGERANKAYELVMNGMPFAQVKRVLEYASTDEVRRDFQLLLASSVSPGTREQEINKMEMQLDRLYRNALATSTGSSVKDADRIKALSLAAKILDQKATLRGFKQPVQHTHNLSRSAAAELDAVVAELASRRTGAFPQEVDIFDAEVVE